jgi:glycerophosphoryl diester phosphodiesterase
LRVKRPLIIAHRGATGKAPENSVAAIQAAAGLGADWVELDVRMTADRRLILIHDDRLGGLEVSSASLEQLRRLNGNLATVEEALDVAEGLGVNLELKGPVQDPQAFLHQLAAAVAGFGGPLLISSFWMPLLVEARERLPEADLGILTAAAYDPDGNLALSAAIEGRYPFALPEDPAVTEDSIRSLHLAGKQAIVWTVDDPNRLRLLADWSVEGIITNDTEIARRATRD